MSTQAIAATTTTTELSPAARVASERVQRLEGMLTAAEGGSASFASSLSAAMGNAGASPTATALAATAGAEASGQGAPAAGGSESPAAYAGMIQKAASQNGIDPAVLHGLIQQESGFDPNSTSSAGAQGLTQLMPGTATSLGVANPLNPAESIAGGARYLGQMLQKFGGNVSDALAAYNAGPGAVQRYGGVPPYAETQQYVTKVLDYANAYRQRTGATVQSAGQAAIQPMGVSVR